MVSVLNIFFLLPDICINISSKTFTLAQLYLAWFGSVIAHTEIEFIPEGKNGVNMRIGFDLILSVLPLNGVTEAHGVT